MLWHSGKQTKPAETGQTFVQSGKVGYFAADDGKPQTFIYKLSTNART